MDELKLEDASRVVTTILPKEKTNLVQIRNYAYDQKVLAMQS